MDGDKLREAFSKVKKDIFTLGEEMQEIREHLLNIQDELHKINNNLKNNEIKTLKNTPTHTPTLQHITPTHQQINPTHDTIPTDKYPLEAPENQNTGISIGNEGVPTDRQTNQQTDRQTNQHIKPEQNQEIYYNDSIQEDDINHQIITADKIQKSSPKNHHQNDFFKVNEILENLDNIKKEIRRKFKNLTSKEMEVFSMLYNLEQQGQIVDYKALAARFGLSESSIRDYIGRIIKKGIPIHKEKLNNKQIILHISTDLKKVASLETIMQLRNL